MVGNVCGKDIAKPTDGFNQQRLMRIDLDFPSQTHDQHVDGAVKHFGAFAVGQLQQLFAA
ncbi:hypothetical protein D3C80_1752550 [compost metagenome]